MDHNDIRHKLSEFIDGAITPGEKAAIERHLKTCTECSDALRELRKTIEHIHAIEEVESPAWMTQKIMAKVREEKEAKNSFWQRIIVPLFTALPVQAVAVLFLSVTAFYIYTTMHPAEKYAEAPMERFAKQEAHDASQDAHKHKASEITERREKKVVQRKEYKSLDMKYEYEKPAPPVPQEQPAASAPAPAIREAPMYAQDKNDLEKRSASSKAAAPSMMAEQAAPPAGKSAQTDAMYRSFGLATATAKGYREGTYQEFVSSVGIFPYKAPAERRKRLLSNYPRLVIGMSKDEVAAILGNPDFADKLQAKDPPFKQLGSEWTYYLFLNHPNLANEKIDQSISIFYSLDGTAHWITPLNIEGFTAKGNPRGGDRDNQ